MNLGNLLKRAGRLASDNSPAILTGVGIAGTLLTAYLTGKASYRAAQALSEEAPDLEPKEKVALTWRLYIPAAGSAILTITAIVCAKKIQSHRTLVATAAWTVAERALTEHRDKVAEVFGENKARGIQEKIAQDRIDRNPVNADQIIVLPTGDHLCREEFTGRVFTGNWELIRSAQNHINEKVFSEGWGSLEDLYDYLKLPYTSQSGDLGWGTDKPLKMFISPVLTADNKPCISFDYQTLPQMRSFR